MRREEKFTNNMGASGGPGKAPLSATSIVAAFTAVTAARFG